jgi:pimeloyl-ACP methyl ester carboxylesterase
VVPIQYTHSGDASIAYQVVDDAGFAADGGCDVVVINGPASHLELMWEEPRTAHTFRQMARYGRLIMHDRRGTGLSDPASEPPALEQQVDDLRAVLAAVNSERVAIIGCSDLGLSALFAATYPEQVTGLVLSGVAADGEHTLTGRWGEQMRAAIDGDWGNGTLVSLFAPSQLDNPGECELRSDDVSGIAVHIASRVMHEAEPREVLASGTVKDLVVGSGLRFADRGAHSLRGVDGEWRLYALDA